MRRNMFTWIAVAAVTVLTLAGCGSSRDSSGSVSSGDDPLASAQTVGINNCLTCHNAASTLIQDWMVSRHGNHMTAAIKIPNDALDVPGDDPSPDHCGYCHPTADSEIADYPYLGAVQPAGTNWDTAVAGEPFIGCESCHGGGQFHNGIAAGIPYPVPGPKQCGQCHYLNDEIANPEWLADGEYPHHTTSGSGNNVRRNVTDTHVDDPATTTTVEGYAIRYNQQNGCVDCHFLGHKMDLTINYQWAESGHAGDLKTIKDETLAAGAADAATLLANVTAAGSPGTDFAWGHYDWDNSSGDSADRKDCQMCHTATGFMNYAKDPANYDPANNDFSHLVGWTQTTRDSGQNELLYCWGCHSDSNGTLRVQGAVTAVYTYNDAPIVFPDVGSSNTCVVCHSGRGNNETVSTSSRFAGHHAPAAADLFSAYSHVAYEYPGLDYTNPVYFAHDGIDAADQGPCVACHMNGEAINHTFSVVTKDTSGVITAINADVCVTCHDGEHGTPFVGKELLGSTVAIWDAGTSTLVDTVVDQAMIDAAGAALEVEAAGYQEAGKLATDLLKNQNGLLNYLSDGTTNVVIDNTLATAVDNDLGAFQNAKLPGDEPGGYAHNRFYVKRALFDAIDWLDNGVMDGTIADYSAVGTSYQYAEATAWLGTTRP